MRFNDWTGLETFKPAPMSELSSLTGLSVIPGNFDIQIKRGIAFPGLILQCADNTVEVTIDPNTSPDVTGLYVPSGTYNGKPLYIFPGTPATFLYYHVNGTYVISQELTDGIPDGYFGPSPAITGDPSGTYVGLGTYFGTATAEDHPIDLTGYTAEAVVKRNDTEEVILDLQPSITDPTVGEVTIPMISSIDTSNLPVLANGHWDFVLSDGSNRFGPYLSGLFIISDNVTQLLDA